MDILNWLFENSATLISIVIGIMSVASLITGLTPSPKDDDILKMIRELLVKLSILKPKDSDGTFKPPFTGDSDRHI